MDDAVETVEYKGYEIKILLDEGSELNPREWDNLGKMVCFHGSYELGDEHDYEVDDFTGWDDMKAHLIAGEKAVVVLPLYMYDHSGLGISIDNSRYPFNCRWDAGQIGFIYTTKELIRKNWGITRVTKQRIAEAKEILLDEVDNYNSFVSGEVYGYDIPELDDSCWGFLGDPEVSGLLADAKERIDYHIDYHIKEQKGGDNQ